MKVLTLVDKNSSSHKIVWRIPITGQVSAVPETQVGDVEVFADFYDALVGAIYSHLGQEAAFGDILRDTIASGDPDMTQYHIQAMVEFLNKQNRYRNFYGTKEETNLFNQSLEWIYWSFSLYAGTYWYLEGADTTTCWYVKFERVNDGRFKWLIYDHDLVLQIQTEFDIDVTSYSSGSSISYAPFMMSFSDLVNAQSAADAMNWEGVYFTQLARAVTDDRLVQKIYSYRVWNSGAYYNWIYYLWNNGGGDEPKDEDVTDNDPYKGGYDPSSTGGGGGGGNPYDEGDDIPYPDDPPVSICDTGLISLYTPSATQLNLLAAYLWSSNFVTSMVKDLYADPMDVIVNVGILPFNVTPAGTKSIKVGDRDTGISANYPDSNYYNFDMGTSVLEEIVGAYTDYSPYTKGQIFIPFVGYVPIDIDAFMGHTIGLKYKVDLCTGSAIAFLMRDSRVYQQFACNVLTNIPLSAANYSQMWGTLLSATAVLAGAGATAGAGLASSGAAAAGESAMNMGSVAKTGASAASDIMTGMATKPEMQKSNNLAATAGLLGNKCAYLILERPNLARPGHQNEFIGYPSFITTQLGGLSGYTRVSSIKLGISGATAKELQEIDNYLKSGVIIRSHVPVTGSGIVLINNSSPNNQINKSMALVADLTGSFKDEVDIVNPVVRIERASAVGFNYVYIADFGRYYYVDEVKAYRNNVLELTLRCDPLQSFAQQILNHTAIIDKQEAQWNLYLNDDSLKMYQNPLYQFRLFDNAFFDDFEYVLITAGS